MYSPKGDRNFIASLKRTMDKLWFGADVSNRAQYPNVLSGEYILSGNNALGGTVGLIGSDANDQVVFPLQASIPLTAAQIITLHSVPVPLIPAPGAGFALLLEEIILEINRTATQFTGGGVVAPTYHALATALTSNTIAATDVTGTAGQAIKALQPNIGASGGLALSANLGIDLFAATADFAAGTGTAKVFVSYSIVTL
jgi:hypothetical protein